MDSFRLLFGLEGFGEELAGSMHGQTHHRKKIFLDFRHELAADAFDDC